MKTRSNRTLVAANAALLLALGAVTLAPAARAQRGVQGTRVRGEYSMVAGKMMGGNSSAVYIVDAANQEMVALRWNESLKALETIGYRNLAADGQSTPGR